MLGNIRLLDSIQKQTINTYHRVLSSRHADFVRKNSTIIAIIAIPTILIAGYAAYHFYNKRHKVT
ncbi:MAG TPA: hypothetical protein PLO43_01180, partial [Chlamydiales bacterium]|nr:hypothetical protein [Chlamydiales bacterium]